MLRADAVSFGYPSDDRPLTLAGVSAHVPEGTLTGLLGPNGCGKTTLLKLLAGLLQPVSGQVLLHGRPLAGYSDRKSTRLNSSH